MAVTQSTKGGRTSQGYYKTIHFKSTAVDPNSLTTGSGQTITHTVTGAALGDLVEVSFSLDLQGIVLTGYVSAANTVATRFQNNTGGTIDLASGTIVGTVKSPAGVFNGL